MKIKKIASYITGLIIMALFSIVFYSYKLASPNPYPEQKTDSVIPSYKELEIPFDHKYNGDKYLPVMASAIIDVDNDGAPAIFLGGGENQADGLFKYKDGKFTDVSVQYGFTTKADPTYGAVVVDLDNDGYPDLIVARDSGTYFYFNRHGKFEIQKFNSFLAPNERAISFSVADLTNTGHVDIFVSAYLSKSAMEGQNIFNKPGYGAQSRLLLNDGHNNFKDITNSAGLNGPHNTFAGIFIDIDGDHKPDLIVAQDTGHVLTYKNMGNLKFQAIPNPMSETFGYPMGIAVGDYNNDGLVDFYFSNVGSTILDFMGRGDLRKDQSYSSKLLLMKNKGNFQFEDVSEQTKTADFEFSWGVVMKDLNLDGRQDILIAENYVDFPLHQIFKLPGRILTQNKNGTFTSIEKEAGLVNRAFEITPLTADFNRDGTIDIVRVNLNGKSKLYISKMKSPENAISVSLPESIRALGAKLVLEFESGNRITNFLVSGEGLCSDQSHEQFFGSLPNEIPNTIVVDLPSGKVIRVPIEKNKKHYSLSIKELSL